MSSTVENQNPAKSIDVECDVTKILEEMGFSGDSDAFGYPRTAIILSVYDIDIINSVTKVLYPSVAKKYQTTTSRVQRAIRHAIEVAWDRGDVDTLNWYLGYTKPTNRDFIASIADHLR